MQIAQTSSTVPMTHQIRLAMLTSLVLAGLILWVYRDTALGMAGIWYRSETFAHGFLIAPISLWLAWRKRKQILSEKIAPSLFGLVALIASGIVWLMGQASNTAVLEQFGLVFMVMAAVWAVWGNAIVKAAAFPLCFLLFCVPFGEFLLPVLMERTADFTIMALRLSGIPVLRNGLSFVIPSGSWSVVEACSGIRYLIASIMVGALFSYLNYNSLKRRLWFMLASILVPLVANWLRAYMIVMIGHLSGNTLAVGVDHLIYGWVFFGLVMFVLFWIGSRWREDTTQFEPVSASANTMSTSRIPVHGFVILAIVCALLWKPLWSWMLDVSLPMQQVILKAPAGQGGWTLSEKQGESLDERKFEPFYHGYKALLSQSYSKEDMTVTLWVAYYAGQKRDAQMVQWDNRLLEKLDGPWRRSVEATDSFQLGDKALPAIFSQLNGAASVMVWNWMWLGGQQTSIRPADVKLALLKDHLLHQPDSSAAVFVIVNSTHPKSAVHDAVNDFLSHNYAGVEQMLQSAQ